MSIIPAIKRWRQEDLEFNAILGYRRPCQNKVKFMRKAGEKKNKSIPGFPMGAVLYQKEVQTRHLNLLFVVWVFI